MNKFVVRFFNISYYLFHFNNISTGGVARTPDTRFWRDVYKRQFQDFLQLDTPPEKRKNEGLYKVFAENFPIADTRNNFVLEFLDYYIDPPRYTIDDCIERGLTYSCLLYTSFLYSYLLFL